ncbi:MAG: PAS domain-containing protein [Gammaproteobacteria bacterium]|uniref:nitrogen regulation protein NR(II) n=1 Tax=Pseudomaricurvus alcaniphilus TaxID=1166482 RepID=UPI00140C2021|nr:nitrogen regulation protein NR(II) [Pseudomaricurvus alcaniphilus]MBR9912921.1 PAS domain-containing protein [Gammaproteobacteria bacterium]NHN38672.1 PAS domain-containing protein [Pseudomaricurvus alcaniphilus]
MAIDEHYKTIFDHLNVSLVTVDCNLRILYLNPSAEMLLAISGSKAINKPFLSHFRDGGTPAEVIFQAARTNSQFTKRQAQWVLHNGQKLTVDYSVTPLPEGDGMIIEIMPLDRLLRISREETLISSQETTRHLVRSLAHEIKNPLGGIRGAAQLLARELASPHHEEFTQIIIEETDRLCNLVDRMLGPRQLPNFKPTNIHEVLEHIARVMVAECGSKIQIQRDYDPSIPEFTMDAELIIQALLNIARNAMQALLEAGGEQDSMITLRTRVQRQFTINRQYHHLVCRIDIEDNGPGIPAAIVSDIFYPMISGRAEGTGLGLAISQHLVQQHQGLIECESQPGQTIFSIYLPLEQNHAV